MSIFDFLDQQRWRYATKKFDATKRISQENIKYILEAAQLSTSSYGLQLYKIIHVKSENIRQAIMPLAWHQKQIVEASDLFIIANYKQLTPEHIDDYIKLMSTERNLPLENLNPYGEFMKTKIFELSTEDIFQWTQKQCYLVLGNMMNAAAALKIDATPMEGFSPQAINELLNLDDYNLHATLLITLGYRHEDDTNQHLKKVRKPLSDLIVEF